MKKMIIGAVLAITLLAGCSAPVEVKPIATTPDPKELLVEPPAAAMVPAHEGIPLVKGDNKAGNAVILRQNNMLCLDDRQKLTTLQKYILGIFPAK